MNSTLLYKHTKYIYNHCIVYTYSLWSIYNASNIKYYEWLLPLKKKKEIIFGFFFRVYDCCMVEKRTCI